MANDRKYEIVWYKFFSGNDPYDSASWVYIPFGQFTSISIDQGPGEPYALVGRPIDCFDTLASRRGLTLSLDGSEVFSRIRVLSKYNVDDWEVIKAEIKKAVQGFYTALDPQYTGVDLDSVYEFVYPDILVLELSTASFTGVNCDPVIISCMRNGWIGRYIAQAFNVWGKPCSRHGSSDLLIRNGCGFSLYHYATSSQEIAEGKTAVIVGSAYTSYKSSVTTIASSMIGGNITGFDITLDVTGRTKVPLHLLNSRFPGQEWNHMFGVGDEETISGTYYYYSSTSNIAIGNVTQEFMPQACSRMMRNTFPGVPFNTSNRDANTLFYFLRSNKDPVDPTDPEPPKPADPDEPSGDEGGDGDKDPNSDPIPPDDLPDGRVGDMVHLYKITADGIKKLHDYLWDTDFFDAIIKLTQSPMECVVALYQLPVNVATAPPVSLQVGNTTTSKVPVYDVANRFAIVDCGSVALKPFWDSFLDYNPYTRVSIYLPYIGMIDLNTDIVMGTSIGVKYKVDLLTGAAVAVVTANGNVVTQINTSVIMRMPISANDMSNNLLQTASAGINLAGSIASGNVFGAASSVVTIVSSQKEHPQAQTNMSGACGCMANRTPFLRVENPVVSQPSNYGKYIGNMIYATGKLSTFSGYTLVESIHLDDFPCLDGEKEALEQLLKSGIII